MRVDLQTLIRHHPPRKRTKQKEVFFEFETDQKPKQYKVKKELKEA
jgi:hypothetical protein